MRRPRLVPALRIAVLGLGAVHCAAQLLEVRPLVLATKPLLVPTIAALAVATSRAAGRRPSPWLLSALAASTAGDVALMSGSTPAWLAGMGAFLVAQGCYVRHFAELGALDALRRRPAPALAYGAGWVAANLAVGPHLGELRWPVLVYSAALATMGASASALGARLAWGGGIFVASDLLIGLGIAGVDVGGQDAAVMATYVAAQYLLVTGAVARADTPAAAGSPERIFSSPSA
ncbi:hypothetical protein GCM10027446_12880 [Angustibacter peucedani]